MKLIFQTYSFRRKVLKLKEHLAINITARKLSSIAKVSVILREL